MSEKTMVMQSFLPRFLPRKRLKIQVLWKHLVFVFATVAKDITNLSPHGKYLRIWRRGERPAPTLPYDVSMSIELRVFFNFCVPH